jgi:hypothetical protein
LVIAAAVLAALGAGGCGQNGPKTHPVRGKVTLAGGDAAQLAGHHVEAMLEGDPAVRASGVIAADGSFALETLHAGEVLKGAREGKYLVRIVPAEEDESGKKLKKPPVAARHLKFETSGLSLNVPASEDVTLPLASR